MNKDISFLNLVISGHPLCPPLCKAQQRLPAISIEKQRQKQSTTMEKLVVLILNKLFEKILNPIVWM